MVKHFKTIGAQVTVMPLSSLRTPWSLPRATGLVRNFDILYSHTSVPGQILGDLAARMEDRSHVVHQHAVPYFRPTGVANLVQRRLFRMMRARRFIAVAPHVREALESLGVPNPRIEVIVNGAPDRAFTEPRTQSAYVCVGMLARLDPGKGIDEFIDAMRPLLSTGTKGVIAGRPGPFLDYERRVKGRLSGAGVRLSEVEDSVNFLAQLDVVAIPSHYEGSPLTMFEAMALGRAIVASDIPGIREVIDHGRTGLLVPPGNADALRGAIASLVEDPDLRTRLGNAARADARERFPMERTVDRCLAVLREVVEEWRRGR